MIGALADTIDAILGWYAIAQWTVNLAIAGFLALGVLLFIANRLFVRYLAVLHWLGYSLTEKAP